MKEQRQKAILKLIQEEDLEVQEELLERLHKLGFACTQATISRDIKELHLVKEHTSSGTANMWCRCTGGGRIWPTGSRPFSGRA